MGNAPAWSRGRDAAIAISLTTEEAGQHLDYVDVFRRWDYGGPHDQELPFEPKPADWGWLDGRIVALTIPLMPEILRSFSNL